MMLAFISALFLALAEFARCNPPPVIIYQPPPSVTVVSPLTTSTSASGQALLDQISSSLSQQRFQHELLTTPTVPLYQPPVYYTRPVVIQGKGR
jgi:hypothetical protein